MKDFEFYQDLDFRYPEIAICLEDSNTDIVKVFIPILTPLLSSIRPYDNKEGNCIVSNYISLKLPKTLMDLKHDADGNLIKKFSSKKGDRFIISFIGGNPNNPFIIGRYD